MRHSFSPTPRTMRGRTLPVAIMGLLIGCDGSKGGADPQLPGFFMLEGSASLQSGTQTLDCQIDFLVEFAGETMRTETFIEYVGTMGGGAGRQVLNPDGSGFALYGDAFSEIRARLTFPDQVVIDSISSPPGPTHLPRSFFEEITHFEGILGSADSISGEWLCAPFFADLGGFADETLFADCVWFTEVISN